MLNILDLIITTTQSAMPKTQLAATQANALQSCRDLAEPAILGRKSAESCIDDVQAGYPGEIQPVLKALTGLKTLTGLKALAALKALTRQA